MVAKVLNGNTLIPASIVIAAIMVSLSVGRTFEKQSSRIDMCEVEHQHLERRVEDNEEEVDQFMETNASEHKAMQGTLKAIHDDVLIIQQYKPEIN